MFCAVGDQDRTPKDEELASQPHRIPDRQTDPVALGECPQQGTEGSGARDLSRVRALEAEGLVQDRPGVRDGGGARIEAAKEALGLLAIAERDVEDGGDRLLLLARTAQVANAFAAEGSPKVPQEHQQSRRALQFGIEAGSLEMQALDRAQPDRLRYAFHEEGFVPPPVADAVCNQPDAAGEQRLCPAMAEGPQVLLRAEWLERQLGGRSPLAVEGWTEELRPLAQQLAHRCIERVRARGKNLFLEFEGGLCLHNHLRMDGRWRALALEDPLPEGLWLSFRMGERRIANVHGEVLQLMTREGMETLVSTLGPDVMAEPFPRQELLIALARARGRIAAALVDQHVVAGVGNIARCEALYRAGLAPQSACRSLTPQQLARLLDALQAVTRESYHSGGRWNPLVYERAGQTCARCQGLIEVLQAESAQRRLYGCARCQSIGVANLFSD